MIEAILIMTNMVLCGALFAMGVIAATEHDSTGAVTSFLLSIVNLLCAICAII